MFQAAAIATDSQRAPRPRRNLASGKAEPRGLLVRFVVGPDRSVVPDIGHCLPGRGLWLSPRRDVLKMAAASRGRLFARAAGGPVAVSQELDLVVERLLVERVISLIGLARRGGTAVMGFERVRESLATMKPSHDVCAVLFVASDASAPDRRRLTSQTVDVTISEVLTSSELGSAFGRDGAVFVAVAPGSLARDIEAEASRLALLRSEDSNSLSLDARVKDGSAR
jgi:predicted RNA-binding protein YlxR (DUF448 family)